MTKPVVEVRGLVRTFQGRRVLDELDLDVRPGRVLGLLGANGAGKTTLLSHLLGLFRAQQGFVRVFGMDPAVFPVEVLSQIGYLSENRDLPLWMTVGELMSYTRALFRNWDDVYAHELRETFELSATQKLRSLSRGQRARAGLLAALAHRPKLLLLDEPSSGLDVIVRRDILSAIIRTVADEGRTVVFSSHLLDEVQRVADEVAWLRHGKIQTQQPLDELLQRYCLLTVVFADGRDSLPTLPGVIRHERSGSEWNLMCNGQESELRAELERISASVIARRSITLEELFVGMGDAR